MIRQTFSWTRESYDQNYPDWILALIKRGKITPDPEQLRLWVETPDGGAVDCYTGNTIVYILEGNREYLTVIEGTLLADLDKAQVNLNSIAGKDVFSAIDTLGKWLKVNRGGPLDGFGVERVNSMLYGLADLKKWLGEKG